jgi:hypothetical protein
VAENAEEARGEGGITVITKSDSVEDAEEGSGAVAKTKTP